ncbi:NADPH-dependent F420 reductase [Aeromicrobium sp.]|nr:NADPH-dependent F420 reductase [Candidatus Saccharibacteria bacterium]
MNIGIIGSGDVALSLGKGLAATGHHVMIGTRNQDKKELTAWKKHVKKLGSIGSTTEAASHGEIIILAVAWHAAEDVLQQIRPELAGKVVIDVTNPLVFREDEPPALSVGFNMSGGEIVQQSLADSHVVKALNTISHTKMVQPEYKEGMPVMFYCGNNVSAKKEVVQLLRDLGWKDVVDLGDITKSRLLEQLTMLWIEYGAVRGGWDHAFSVLNQ